MRNASEYPELDQIIRPDSSGVQICYVFMAFPSPLADCRLISGQRRSFSQGDSVLQSPAQFGDIPPSGGVQEWSPAATSRRMNRSVAQQRESVGSDGEDLWLDGLRQRMSPPCLGSAPARATSSREGSRESLATALDGAEEEDWQCPICHEIFGKIRVYLNDCLAFSYRAAFFGRSPRDCGRVWAPFLRELH